MSRIDYFDSSALVKRYFTETGSDWVIARCQDPTVLIATTEISRVEIAAAFAGKLRGSFITQTEYREARLKLMSDAQKRYHLLPVNTPRIDEAIELTARHKLRGYDAVHLACALDPDRALHAENLSSLTFVTADLDLLSAAQAEGLTTDNPNDHP